MEYAHYEEGRDNRGNQGAGPTPDPFFELSSTPRVQRWIFFMQGITLIVATATLLVLLFMAGCTQVQALPDRATPQPTFTPTKAAPIVASPDATQQAGDIHVIAEIRGAAGDWTARAYTNVEDDVVAEAIKSGANAEAHAEVISQDSPRAIQTQTERIVPTARPLRNPTPTPALGDSFSDTLLGRILQGSNLRSGPGLDYAIVDTALEGETYRIAARNGTRDWYQVQKGERALWIFWALIDPFESVDDLPVAIVPSLEPKSEGLAATSTPMPTIALDAEPTSAPYEFSLVEWMRDEEANSLVIYASVLEGDRSLDGYRLKLTRDGADVSNGARSSSLALGTIFSGRPDFQERDRQFNMKWAISDFTDPLIPQVGQWSAQLIDGGGKLVGPALDFTIKSGDTQKQIYLRYSKS